MKIIYPTLTGIAIIYPIAYMDIKEIARKDVPAGVPYLIINDSDIPEDKTYIDAWEADFTSPHGVGIGAEAWFLEQETK